MAATYWYVLVAIGFAAFAIWGVIKTVKSWSLETGNTDTPIEKHFVDNGDGTVIDSLTGLSWMRFAMGQIWDGIACTGVATLYTCTKNRDRFIYCSLAENRSVPVSHFYCQNNLN